jgi:hypothetical protein
LVHFDEIALEETCHLTILKMRRRKHIDIRILAGDGEYITRALPVLLKKLIYGKGRFRTEIKLEVTVAGKPEIQELITEARYEYGGEREYTPGWETPTEEDLKLM